MYEYDAQTDHGNSGSPMFDLATGQVYGYVSFGNTGATGALQNNVAFAVAAIRDFAQNAHVALNFAQGDATLASYCSDHPHDANCSTEKGSPGDSSTDSQNMALSDCNEAQRYSQQAQAAEKAQMSLAAAEDYEKAPDYLIACGPSESPDKYPQVVPLAASASTCAAIERILAADPDSAKADWRQSDTLIGEASGSYQFAGDEETRYEKTVQANSALASEYGWGLIYNCETDDSFSGDHDLGRTPAQCASSEINCRYCSA